MGREILPELRHPPGLVDVGLVLGDLREDRQLLGLLESAETDGRGAGLRRDGHHRGVSPVSGGDGGDGVTMRHLERIVA